MNTAQVARVIQESAIFNLSTAVLELNAKSAIVAFISSGFSKPHDRAIMDLTFGFAVSTAKLSVATSFSMPARLRHVVASSISCSDNSLGN